MATRYINRQVIVGDFINEIKSMPDWCSDARDKKLRKVIKLTKAFQPQDLVRVRYKQGRIHTHLVSIDKVGA